MVENLDVVRLRRPMDSVSGNAHYVYRPSVSRFEAYLKQFDSSRPVWTGGGA